jgi:hypothetical protein
MDQRQASGEETGQGGGAGVPPGRAPADRVYGIVAVVALVLAAVFGLQMLRGAPGDAGAAPAPVPALEIVEPADGAEVVSPVAVVLRTAAPLAPGPMGWAADGRHLHLRAGAAEVMAGNADLAPAGADRYRWTVALPHGEHTLRLYWSGADHQPMEAGASRPVRIRVR